MPASPTSPATNSPLSQGPNPLGHQNHGRGEKEAVKSMHVEEEEEEEDEGLDNGGGETRVFRGVRKRSWGKWVAEIREPRKRSRIWLGSYTSPRRAALAFDVASYLLRGNSSRTNLPHLLPPSIKDIVPTQLSPRSVQKLAIAIAHSNPTSPTSPPLLLHPSSSSSSSSSSSNLTSSDALHLPPSVVASSLARMTFPPDLAAPPPNLAPPLAELAGSSSVLGARSRLERLKHPESPSRPNSSASISDHLPTRRRQQDGVEASEWIGMRRRKLESEASSSHIRDEQRDSSEWTAPGQASSVALGGESKMKGSGSHRSAKKKPRPHPVAALQVASSSLMVSSSPWVIMDGTECMAGLALESGHSAPASSPSLSRDHLVHSLPFPNQASSFRHPPTHSDWLTLRAKVEFSPRPTIEQVADAMLLVPPNCNLPSQPIGLSCNHDDDNVEPCEPPLIWDY